MQDMRSASSQGGSGHIGGSNPRGSGTICEELNQQRRWSRFVKSSIYKARIQSVRIFPPPSRLRGKACDMEINRSPHGKKRIRST